MPHIVRRGETLSKIAKANGLTLAQLLDANPMFRSHPNDIQAGDVLIIPGEEGVQPPPLTGTPTPSAFATRLAAIAEEQHRKFQFTNEADPVLCSQIKKWTQDIGFRFTSCTRVAWSAVFVSWCVKEAGATAAEFKFAMSHSV